MCYLQTEASMWYFIGFFTLVLQQTICRQMKNDKTATALFKTARLAHNKTAVYTVSWNPPLTGTGSMTK